MGKLCIIYNTAPKYREAIFQSIDVEYDCDWYFGKTKSDIKEMDTSLLKNVTYYKTIGNPDKIYWKFGVLHLLFKKKYNCFFMLAEVRSVTDWIFFWLASTLVKRKKVFIWTHGWYGRENWFEAKMKLWLFRHVAGTFVYGDRARELLINKGIPKDKLFAIHNSLDYDKHIQLRGTNLKSSIYKDHFGNDNHILMMIGRLNLRKKIDMLIKAVHILKNKGYNYNIVLIGDGSDKNKLIEMANDYNITNQVWFYGACYNEQTNASLLYNADMCVVPGDVGLTAIHTMTFGVPVITHNFFPNQGPEFEAIKPGLTGDFFERDNVDSLVSVIQNWFSTKANMREEVRQACYKEIDTNWNPHYQMELLKKELKLV